MERINVRQDNVDRVRWYSHKSSNRQLLANAWMEVYIGQEIDPPHQTWLRLRIYWENERWGFFNGITINTDGVRQDWDGLDFKRDFASRNYRWVKETIDLPVDAGKRATIEAIINSQNAVLRLRGDRGNWDIAIDANDRLIYRDILTAFEILQETPQKQPD